MLHSAIAASQVQTSLFSGNAASPLTATGISWDFTATQDGGAALCRGSWAIVFVDENNDVETMAIADTNNLYVPEKNILARGSWNIFNYSGVVHFHGQTKSMRKMMIGDNIYFIALGVATNTTSLSGTIQLFNKY